MAKAKPPAPAGSNMSDSGDRVGDPGRRRLLESCAGFLVLTVARPSAASRLGHGDLQPLQAQVRRLIEAMAHLGEPFAAADVQTYQAAEDAGRPAAVEAGIDA